MLSTDTISHLGLALSVLSIVIALYALNETKKTNRISLLEKRMRIYDAFHLLAFEAVSQGKFLTEETVENFKAHAAEAEKLLPEKLSSSICSFYADCERVVWIRTLQPPVDQEYIDRGIKAAERVRTTALTLDEKFLYFIKSATDA